MSGLEISKRLARSLGRIRKQGGVVLCHHTREGSTVYQLSNGGLVSESVVAQLQEAGALIPGGDELFEGLGAHQTFHVAA